MANMKITWSLHTHQHGIEYNGEVYRRTSYYYGNYEDEDSPVWEVRTLKLYEDDDTEKFEWHEVNIAAHILLEEYFKEYNKENG